MKNLPRHLKLNLAPLLLSLAVSQSYAVEVIVVGDGGVAGLAGATLGAAGTAGTSATAVSGGASHTMGGLLQLSVSGGGGGDGGRGGPISETVSGGDGGNGGHGAAAVGRASLMADALDVAVQSLVMGGNGGRGGAAGGTNTEFDYPPGEWPYDSNPRLGRGGVAGQGGNAASTARAVTGGAGNVDVKAVALGGGGGAVEGKSALGGNGGGATGSAYGQSGSGRVGVTAEAYGGNGGNGEVYRRATGGSGASVALIDAVSGRTSGELVLAQHAAGGNAGSGGEEVYGDDWPPVGERAVAGSAESRLSINDAAASAITARVSAQGGTGAGRSDYWSAPQSNAGGMAVAGLTLASTRAGTPLDGTVHARGGTGSTAWLDSGGTGGRAEAVGRLSGRGDVRGNATAQGGSGGSTPWMGAQPSGGNGGDASATLDLAGTGMASGSAAAYGGAPGEGSNYYGSPALGGADAALSLAGAGAQGSAFAQGQWANSAVSARTSGALAVDVEATARGGGASASIDVVAGGRANAAAKVTAAAYATSSGSSYSGPVSTRVDVQASGAISAVGEARSGDTYYDWRSGPPRSGDADSSVRGVTGGDHAVSLRAIARAGDTEFGNFSVYGTSAAAAASALGQSGRGAVDVLADAHAGGGTRVFELDAYGRASASATAINLERGGRGIARATIWGGSGDVLASASGVGKQGTTVRVTGAAATLLPSEPWIADLPRTVRGAAVATNYFDASAFGLRAYGGDTQIVSNVSAAPDTAAELGGLALGPVVAGGMTSLAGVGMQALGTDSTRPSGWWNPAARMTASGRFEFDGLAGRHLLVGLVSSSFSGAFDSLELSITNHGVALFSRLFTDADEARLFFSDRLLDLGLFGAGMQDVLVSTLYTSYEPGTFAFNYVVGAGAGVTAVPEASTWLMLVLGLGAVLAVAVRRRPAGCRA